MSNTATTTTTTTLNDTIENVFHLPKPKKSIFVNLEMREYPSYEKIYGFINNKMGFKLRKKHLSIYRDEHLLYKKYIKMIKWNEDLQFIAVNYYQKEHGWGRVFPEKSLSLSLFPRRSRHSFCENNYFDADQINAQPNALYQKALQAGITHGIDGLREYCENPIKCRQDIVNHYCLTDIINEDGSIKRAKDQAKELTFRLAFGGSIYKWKQEFQVKRTDDLPMIKNIEICLKKIAQAINMANPQIRADLEKDETFQVKSEDDKLRTITSTYSQTLERIIQEECVGYLVKNYRNVNLIDIVPSQDGMMLLKKQMNGINLDILLQQFNELIKRKLNLDIKWTIKPFDEAIPIIPSKLMPIDIFLEDLDKGERWIAELVAPAFKSTFKYFNVEKEKYWYILTKNIWVKQSAPDEFKIIKVLQEFIEEEKLRAWNDWKVETNEEKKKELNKKEALIKKHYEKVGKGNYASQLIKYLSSLLKDNEFPNKLDNTKGLFVFKDCILELKTGKTRAIVPEDYISFVNEIEYLKLSPPNEEKTDFILSNLKKTFNNNQEHLEYGLSAIGYSLTGDAGLEKAIYCFKDGTDAEKGNNGKSLPFKLLKGIFPKIVDDTPYRVFEEKFNNSHKFIRDWRHLRLLYCDEGSNNKINTELVKLVGAGEPIKNEIMFGYRETIVPQFKFFLCSNVLFNVGKDSDAVFNRYKECSFNSHFDIERTEDDYETLQFKADKNLPDKLINEYSDELIHLFINYALKYYKRGGMPSLPNEFAKATALTKRKNNEFAMWFWDNFETGSGNISIDDLLYCSTTITDRAVMYKELKKIEIETNKELKGFGKKKNEKGDEVYIKGGIVGFVKINKEE